MSTRPVTPARRRRRILRDTLLLAVVLAVLVLRMDFPVFTADQALAATQARYFFGPGEVIAALDNPQEWDAGRFGPGDRYYILRWGDWYAWCGISRSGPFWRTGSLGAVENDPSLPLIPLVVDEYSYGSVLVVCNDPGIARVELVFPVSSPETDSGCTLLSASGGPATASLCPGRWAEWAIQPSTTSAPRCASRCASAPTTRPSGRSWPPTGRITPPR